MILTILLILRSSLRSTLEEILRKVKDLEERFDVFEAIYDRVEKLENKLDKRSDRIEELERRNSFLIFFIIFMLSVRNHFPIMTQLLILIYISINIDNFISIKNKNVKL